MIRPVWLASIDWAGRAWWAASERVDGLTVDGEEVAVDGLLSVAYTERLPRLSLDGPDTGATVEVDHDAADWAALRAMGHRWATAKGRLYLAILDGDTIAQPPELLVSGALRAVEYGDPDEPHGRLRATIRAGRLADTARLLPDAATLTAERWPDLAPTGSTPSPIGGMAGKAAALVIGLPGWVDGAPVAAVPAYPVEWSLGPHVDTVILACHPLTVGSVWLTDGAGEWRSVAVTTQADALGDLVAVADVTGIATGPTPHLSRDVSTRYWWAHGTAEGVGPFPILAPSGRCGLGSAVHALLLRGALPVDSGRMAPSIEALDAVTVAAIVQNPDASPLEVVQELLGVYPCTLTRSGAGLYLAPHAPPPSADSCPHYWLDGVDVARVGAIEVEDDEDSEPVASVTVRYAPTEGSPARSLTVDDALGLSLDPDAPALTIDAPQIWSSTDAHAVALAQARLRPLAREVVSVRLPPRLHAVRLGQWAALASDSLARTLVGQVVARTWTRDGVWLVELVVDDLPAGG